jgi:hypothetical protein
MNFFKKKAAALPFRGISVDVTGGASSARSSRHRLLNSFIQQTDPLDYTNIEVTEWMNIHHKVAGSQLFVQTNGAALPLKKNFQFSKFFNENLHGTTLAMQPKFIHHRLIHWRRTQANIEHKSVD